MVEPYFESSGVTIYHCDCRDVLASLTADVVVTDPPYGETSLKWDVWQTGWIELLQASSMWCCGSLRMFLEHIGEFGGWKMSQDVIWKKHNGSNFHKEATIVCEVCSRDYSEDGAPITDYQRWLAAPEPCPNCGGVQRSKGWIPTNESHKLVSLRPLTSLLRMNHVSPLADSCVTV